MKRSTHGTEKIDGNNTLAWTLTCVALLGCYAPPEDKCPEASAAKQPATVQPMADAGLDADAQSIPDPAAKVDNPPAPESQLPDIRYADLYPTALNFVDAIGEGDVVEIRKRLTAPFRLSSGNAVEFCGDRTDSPPVLTRADTEVELDRIAECIAADVELRKALAPTRGREFQAFGRHDIRERPSMVSAEFEQPTDAAYGYVERRVGNPKNSEVIQCIFSFREGDDYPGEPELAGFACGFDVRC